MVAGYAEDTTPERRAPLCFSAAFDDFWKSFFLEPLPPLVLPSVSSILCSDCILASREPSASFQATDSKVFLPPLSCSPPSPFGPSHPR